MPNTSATDIRSWAARPDADRELIGPTNIVISTHCFAAPGASSTQRPPSTGAHSAMTDTWAPSEKVRSVRSSPPASTTDDLPIIADADMAWLLALVADASLTGYERTMTFVELGCGEHHLAIERVLNAVMSRRMTLSMAIMDRLTRWLDGYLGSPEEPRLRAMVGEIQARQCQPARLRTQQAQCGDVLSIVAPACSASVA
jgi:hypothetical protein